MKKLLLGIVLTIVLLFSCVLGVSFEEISQPYLDQYGEPDEIRGTENKGAIWWEWNLGHKMLTVFFFDDYDGWRVSVEEFWYTFEQVSQPYLDQYGQPEDVYEHESPNYHSIGWWWWSQGFKVNFLWTTYDDVRGWVVNSTYSFPPI